MLDRSSLRTSLRRLALERLSGRAESIEFFLFGSALREPAPADIDLLVVYARRHISPQEALSFRESIRNSLSDNLDVCLLSDVEARTNPFIREEGCVRL